MLGLAESFSLCSLWSMASQEHWQRVRCIDWLRHRWAFTIRDPSTVVGGARFQVVAEGVDVAAFDSREAAQAWTAEALQSCLAELIASHPELHPADVVIDSGGRKRLGRIKPELWGSWDGMPATRTSDCLTVLSAKARAAFPNEPQVFVRVRRRSR